jgi:hypothetical protein
MHTITISLPDNLYERISVGKAPPSQKSLNVSVTITAAAARRKVNAYLASALGNLLLSGEPALTITDRIVWRVPVDVTNPIDGRIGHIGDVDVDAENGELLITSSQLNQLIFTIQKDDLPRETTEALTQLDGLATDDLWAAARLTAPVEKQNKMQTLLDKQKMEGLTSFEKEEIALLGRFFDQIMLVRAKAAALLKARGQNIEALFTSS